MQHLLRPSTTTPKTETIIQPIFEEAIKSFAELRGDWMRRSLGVMVNRVDEVDEGGIWEGGRGREKVRVLVGLWEVLVVILEVSQRPLLGRKLSSNRPRLSSLLLFSPIIPRPPSSHSLSPSPSHWPLIPSNPH